MMGLESAEHLVWLDEVLDGELERVSGMGMG
jgi:hypothetical protein